MTKVGDMIAMGFNYTLNFAVWL